MHKPMDEEHQETGDFMTLKEAYFYSVVISPRSISQFKFYEDASVKSGTDRYMLLCDKKETAIFQATGTLTYLSVTPAGAVQHRKPGAKVDEYSVRLEIDDEKHAQEIEKGFEKLVDLLKNTEKACEDITVLSGLVDNRRAFKLEECIVKVSCYSNNLFYFNRKVATRDRTPVDDGLTPDFMLNFPLQGEDYPSLKYPTGWNLNPLIPVTDTDAIDLKPEGIEFPRRATVDFEMRQGCYNFMGKDGPVKQIVLVPSIIAVKVYLMESKDMTESLKSETTSFIMLMFRLLYAS